MKKKILLVEDNKVQKIVSERMLIKAGYLVLSAVDGEEALFMANEQLPDLVLLDMLLPKVSGLEVLQRLRNSPQTMNLPIIALSALPEANSAKLQAEGVDDYFEKSQLFDTKQGGAQLLQMIAKLIQRREKRLRLETTAAHATAQ